MKIEDLKVGDVYTNEGKQYTIASISKKHIALAYDDGIYTVPSSSFFTYYSKFDPTKEWKLDDILFCGNKDGVHMELYHYAGVKDGDIYVFTNGTSETATKIINASKFNNDYYNVLRLATKEEIEKYKLEPEDWFAPKRDSNAVSDWVPFQTTETSRQPVGNDVVVQVKLKSGLILKEDLASRFRWSSSSNSYELCYDDIVSFRIVASDWVPFETTETSRQPVDNDVVVQVKLKSGLILKDFARGFRWSSSSNSYESCYDNIVAFRIVKS